MKESLSNQAYEMIKAGIVTCEFRPGQQIAQPSLAERYGIGETPIREALHRLAQENLVQSVPRYGYVVSQITTPMVVDTYETRLINEPAAARLAAVRGPSSMLDELAASQNFDFRPGDRSSYLGYVASNSTFHHRIAQAAGNGRLLSIITQLHDESTRIFHLGLNLEEDVESMRREHIEIARAIQAREAERAESLMRTHIARTQARVLEALSATFGLRPLHETSTTRPQWANLPLFEGEFGR